MLNGISNADRAEILTQALPYIRQYNGKTVVVKYGGNAMINEGLKQQVMEDIVLLQLIGIRIVLIHGGGPEISEMMDKLELFVRDVALDDITNTASSILELL